MGGKSSKEKEQEKEEASFLYYLKNQHSLLSLIFVSERDGFPRVARFFLFIFALVFNLFLVAAFLGKMNPTVQVVVVILIMVPTKLVMKCILRRAYNEKDDTKRIIRVVITMLLTLGGAVGAAASQLVKVDEDEKNAVVARFFISWAIGLAVEVGILLFLYSFCATCCPCCKGMLDAGEESKTEKKKGGGCVIM